MILTPRPRSSESLQIPLWTSNHVKGAAQFKLINKINRPEEPSSSQYQYHRLVSKKKKKSWILQYNQHYRRKRNVSSLTHRNWSNIKQFSFCAATSFRVICYTVIDNESEIQHSLQQSFKCFPILMIKKTLLHIHQSYSSFNLCPFPLKSLKFLKKNN